MSAMNAAQRAALERLIAGATDRNTLGSALLMTLAEAKGADVQGYVSAARHMASDGMQIDEARAFIKAMEDPQTLAVIGQILTAIPPDAADDRMILDWAWIEAHRAIQQYAADHPSKPTTGEPSADDGFRFATDFLFGWPGGVSDLFQLSPATSAAERAANRAHKTLYQHTVCCPYFHNSGDGDGRHPVNALVDVGHTNAVLTEIRTAGLAVIGFIFSDSHKISKADQPAVAAETVRLYDSKVAAWNLYLEPKDTADEATVAKVAAAVRKYSAKPIFIHTYPAASNPASIEQYTKQPWCDGVLVQVSHPAKPIAMRDVPAVAAALLAASRGKWCIAMEYSWTAQERDMGDQWILHGLHGVGDGCNAQYIPRLPVIRRALAPFVPEPTTRGRLTFSKGTLGKRYVAMRPHVDRRTWGRNTGINGQPDGLLYGRRKGETAWHKIEWILPGRQETGLQNAYADVADPKYNLGWKSGETVELQVRDAFGRVKEADLWGECITP